MSDENENDQDPENQEESGVNLAKAIFDKIEALGIAKAAKFFGKTNATIGKWQGGTVPPDLSAGQKILDEILAGGGIDIPVFATPPPQGQTKPDKQPEETPKATATSDGNPSQKLTLAQNPVAAAQAAKKFSIAVPINRDMSFAVVLSLLGNWKATLPVEIRPMLGVMDFEPDTLVHRARNILATRFLASGNEWSFWMDSDIIAPIGNANWFRRRTATKYADKWFTLSALERLTARGKTLIGAVYCERSQGGRLVTQPGLSPRDEGDKKLAEEIKSNGPQERIVQVGWLGFGCVAVHRSVFEDILKSQPDVRAKTEGEPHGFFTAIENGPQGEDVAFCKRAAEAGHPAFLDLSLFCGHVGKFAFMP